jgi:peptidoglycan/LPS O-acetylase OafA/YrhL
MTLGEALETNRGVGPGFHTLRHVLAALILIHHCRVMVFGASDAIGKGSVLATAGTASSSTGQLALELMRPGLFALVGMFFALSGFLVVASALRTRSTSVFFLNRVARILPALSVEITLSALLLGPMVTTFPLSSYFSDPQFIRYFGNIAGAVTFELPGVFSNNPWPKIVNANLWTLPPEFWCYLLMLGLMVTGLVSKPKWLNAAILGSVLIATILGSLNRDYYSIKENTTHFTVWYIVIMFFIGAIFYINADRIVLNIWLAFLCAIGYYFLILLDIFGALSGVFLAYCTVYIGMQKFSLFDRLQKDDISYGTYLYGFPLSQAVVFFVLPHLDGITKWQSFFIILPISILLTYAIATLSWKYIEKPILDLRKHFYPKQAIFTRRKHAPEMPLAAKPSDWS